MTTEKIPTTALGHLQEVLAGFDNDTIRAQGVGLIALSNAREYATAHMTDNLDFEALLVQYHEEVWNAARDCQSGIPCTSYDDAGKDAAKELIRMFQAQRTRADKLDFRAHCDAQAAKVAQMPDHVRECVKSPLGGTVTGCSSARAAYFYIRERGEGEEWRGVSEQAYHNASSDPSMDTTTLWHMYQSEKDNRERFQKQLCSPELQQKYDDVLLPFLAMMRKELHANAGKGDRPGWLAMSPADAVLEIFYHMGKLQRAAKKGTVDEVSEYAADVANMSMMLLDIFGGLGEWPSEREPKTCQCPKGTDRTITQGGHFPSCTACHRRLS